MCMVIKLCEIELRLQLITKRNFICQGLWPARPYLHLNCIVITHTSMFFVFSVKCGNKTVKKSYFTVCKPCADQQQICGKCGKNEYLVSRSVLLNEYLVCTFYNMVTVKIHTQWLTVLVNSTFTVICYFSDSEWEILIYSTVHWNFSQYLAVLLHAYYSVSLFFDGCTCRLQTKVIITQCR